ncbi:hypothetical protein Droror1_Dr00026689 [Drosera rotundifolia]
MAWLWCTGVAWLCCGGVATEVGERRRGAAGERCASVVGRWCDPVLGVPSVHGNLKGTTKTIEEEAVSGLGACAGLGFRSWVLGLGFASFG